MTLPYELIGRVTVFIIMMAIAAAIIIPITYAIWYHGLTFLVNNVCWYGYEPPESPPRYRRLAAIALVSLRDLDAETWRQRHEIMDKF